MFPLGRQSWSEANFLSDTSPKSIDRESLGERAQKPVPVRLSPRPSRSISHRQVEHFKAGVHMNLSEILVSLKRG